MFNWEGQKLFFNKEKIGQLSVHLRPQWPYYMDIKEIELGVYQCVLQFSNPEPTRQPLGRLEVNFETAFSADFTMIPAVSYNGNEWGSGNEPKGLSKDGIPWSFAHHRTAIAGATCSQNRFWSVSLFGQYSDSGFSCSLKPGDHSMLHQLIWPEEEMPVSYNRRDQYTEGYQEEWVIEPNQSYTVTAYLVIQKVEKEQSPWMKLQQVAWRMNEQNLTPHYSPQRIWELGIQYVKESLWVEEGPFKGTSIGRTWLDGQWKHRPTWKYKIGWTGQNISLANSLLYDYIRTGNSESLSMGLATLDSWSHQARLPNGLIRCHFDYLIEGSIPDKTETQDAVHLGDAAMNFFEAAELVDKLKLHKPEYEETALGLCDFVVNQQVDSGRIGISWYNSGALADPDGTIGCALVSPLVKAYKRTGKSEYLVAAERGYHYYINELMGAGFTTAGALDTHCIDKEAAIPLLEAAVLLYEITQNKQYIKWAEYASWYLSTWQWQHSVIYPEDSVMKQLDYNTFGGTSVSTQHHHLDPYALKFVRHWITLSSLTGDPAWYRRAYAAWCNGMIGISDGNLEVMGKTRPAGSQDEGFYHTRWCFQPEKGYFAVSEWLVAWPTAFRLETLRLINDWSLLSSSDRPSN